MTWRRKENNNYNNKSLILLGKVSNIDHMKSFGSIKDQISRDIIIQHEIPLTTFSIVLLGLSVPFSFVTGLNTIQCTLPTSASNGLLCKCSNYLNIFSVIFSSNHATPISPLMPSQNKKLETLLKVLNNLECPPQGESWHSAKISGILLEPLGSTNLPLYKSLPFLNSYPA